MRLIWTASDGRSTELTSNYKIISIEGFGGTPAQLQMQKAPYQDGQTLIGQTLDTRSISIHIKIQEDTVEEAYKRRRSLNSIFNPKLGVGTLRWEPYKGLAYEIKATSDGGPDFPNTQLLNIQDVIIYLRAPDPTWVNPKKEELVLASFVGGFQFPFEFPLELGMVGQSLVIDNKGDIESPVILVFNGPLKNPVITNNTTGKKISVVQQIADNEKLEINTAFGQKYVTIIRGDGTRENAFHYVSPDSEFWSLIPGLNRVSYSATDDSDDASVILSFYHRYVGV